jgi:hypothetical protein
MALEQFSNNAATTLNGAINNSVTSLVVTSATGFPSAGNFRIIIESEILLVTAVSGTTFTVTRAQESTSAASHADTTALTHVLTASGLTQGIHDYASTGFVLSVTNPGVNLATTDISASGNVGYLVPMILSSPMLIASLGFQITTGASGTVQWGLFNFTANAAAATQLATGSGTLTSTGYQTVAATSAPVLVNPGGYALIVYAPTTNYPSWRRSLANSNTVPMCKFQSPYTWTTTPDLTTGWTTDSVIQNFILHGKLASGTAW